MEEEKEVWLPVPNSANIRVSNLGRVKRGRKIVKPYPDKDGYLRIRMGPELGFQYIHRVVAQLFVPNPENKPVVDHINNCKTDNAASNLRFCTISENSQFAADKGLLAINNKNYLLIVDENGVGQIFKTAMQAENVLGISHRAISQVVSGKMKTTHGYRCFKLKDIQMNQNVSDDGYFFGNTLDRGNYSEVKIGNYCVRISDDNPRPKAYKELADLCRRTLSEIIGAE